MHVVQREGRVGKNSLKQNSNAKNSFALNDVERVGKNSDSNH